jgi:hypothetical protein
MAPILVVSLSSFPPLITAHMPFPPAKCLHRKTRCTHVKFHRQTAPLGPGHPARPPHDSSNPAHPPLGALPLGLGPYRLSDPFFLANDGPALNPSALSQSNPLYADHQFSFPPPPQPPVPGQGPIYIIVDGLDECPDVSGNPSAREEVRYHF